MTLNNQYQLQDPQRDNRCYRCSHSLCAIGNECDAILVQKGGVFDVFSPHLSRPLWGKTLTSPGCWKCLETRPWVGVIHHILGISSTKIRMVHHSSCLIFGCFQKSKMDICVATPTGLRPVENEEFRKAGDGSAATKPATNCSIWRLYR